MTDSSELSPAVARLVADAADAFQARRARGEDPDPEEYAARHPEAADAIRGVLGLLRWALPASPAVSLAVPDPTPPRVLGDFRVGREVGRGGMGVVYEAEQISLGRRVALKVLPFAALVEPRLLHRFHNEARAAAGLDHPHVVKVYGVGQDRGVHYIAMQFVDGRPLSDLIAAVHGTGPSRSTDATGAYVPTTVPVARASTVPEARTADFVRRAVDLGVQAADALEHAHALGVVHRDVKPGNLLIDAAGDLWVADFGLAKLAAADAGVTGTGDVFGTLRYMSPEQALAKHDLVDHRTDVYALGATLYELLAGRPAAPGSDKVEILRQVTESNPVPVRRLNRAVPADLETVVHKCLRKDAADRYSSAKELADDLRRFARGEPVVARPVGIVGRVARWQRRNRGLAAALGVAAVALVGVAAVSAGWAVRERQNSDQLGRALYDAEYRLAENYLDQGVWRCETGDVRAGLLWMARALEKAPPGSDRLQETIRMQLAGWSADVAPLIAAVDCPGPITTAALSPDGKVAWIAGQDRVVRRWDIEIGALTEGPTLAGLAQSLQWSPDGKIVLCVGRDGTVQWWDADTGRLISQAAGSFRSATWTTDGAILLTGGRDSRVYGWNARTGAPRGPVISQSDRVQALAVSPDGRTVLTADGSSVRFWDLATGREDGDSLPHATEVTAIEFSQDGRTVVTLCGRFTAVWDVATRRPIGRPVRHTGLVAMIAFDRAGRTYLTAGYDRTVRQWDASTAEPAGPPITHLAPVIAVAVDPEGRLLTAGTDGAVRLWGPPSPADRGPSLAHRGLIMSAVWSPDAETVLTGSLDSTARVWDAATGHALGGLSPGRPVVGVDLSPDGRTALAVTLWGDVRLWDARTGRPTVRPLPHRSPLSGATFSPDGRTVVTGTGDGTVCFWDVATGALRNSVRAHGRAVFVLAVDTAAGRIATGGSDGQIWMWDPATGQPVGRPLHHGDEVRALAFDGTGHRIASGGINQRVRVWDTTTGAQVGPDLDQGSGVRAVALSPDGRTVLAGVENGTARLWEVASGRPLGEPLRHHDEVWLARFGPDGRTALTGSRDGTARLWDSATGRPIGRPMTHDGHIRSVGFAPDGRRILTAGGDLARVWTVPRPQSGSVEEVVLRTEVVCGLTLDDQDVLQALRAAEWEARRRRSTAGGPPP